MKKLVAAFLTLLCLTALTGCEDKNSLEYIVAHAPRIVGTVEKVYENAIHIVTPDGLPYSVSLDVSRKESERDFFVGDIVTVYYDGTVAESYPMQIHTVYAISTNDTAESVEKYFPKADS